MAQMQVASSSSSTAGIQRRVDTPRPDFGVRFHHYPQLCPSLLFQLPLKEQTTRDTPHETPSTYRFDNVAYFVPPFLLEHLLPTPHPPFSPREVRHLQTNALPLSAVHPYAHAQLLSSMRASWFGPENAQSSQASPPRLLLEHFPPLADPPLPASAHQFPEPPVTITLHSPLHKSPRNEPQHMTPPATPVLLAANGPPHVQLPQTDPLPPPGPPTTHHLGWSAAQSDAPHAASPTARTTKVEPEESVLPPVEENTEPFVGLDGILNVSGVSAATLFGTMLHFYKRARAPSPEHSTPTKEEPVEAELSPSPRINTPPEPFALNEEHRTSCKRCSEQQLPCGNVRPCGQCIQSGQGDTCDDTFDVKRRVSPGYRGGGELFSRADAEAEAQRFTVECGRAVCSQAQAAL
ncbi:unnamed protein product [Peniophora sp. CBMAI 1063]|nr:unnamed protein product [Peniophora sp. CBMAI 1063]